jgi:hypothetical protein
MFLLPFLILLGALPALAGPYLTYSTRGERMSWEMTVQPGGEVAIDLKDHKGEFKYDTRLNPEELQAVKAQVKAVDFFSLPEDPGERPLRSHFAIIRACVDDGARQRCVKAYDDGPLDPFAKLLYRLVAQAEILRALRTETDSFYLVPTAFSTNLAGAKVLQPAALRPALIEYFQTHEDLGKISQVFEALCWSMTPEELLGFTANQLEQPARRGLMLQVLMGAPGNWPETTQRALCPVYVAYLREAAPRRAQLSSEEGNYSREFMSRLGQEHYQPALPLLLQWFDEWDRNYVQVTFSPLAYLGESILRPMLTRLETPNEERQLNAIQVMLYASRAKPIAQFATRQQHSYYAQTAKELRQLTLPALQRLASDDPSPKVRQKAAETLPLIETELAEFEARTAPTR